MLPAVRFGWGVSLGCVVLSGSAISQEAPATRSTLQIRQPLGTVNDALKLLGAQSGERLVAGERSLGEQPLVLYVQKRHASQAATQLAAFLESAPGTCKWVPAGEGRMLREEPEGRRARQNRAALQRSSRARQLTADIQSALRVGLLPEEELQRERRRHPELVLSAARFRPGLALLASLNAEQRDALLSGQALTFKIGELNAEQQGYAQVLVGNSGRTRRSMPPELGGGWLEWIAERDLPKTEITVRLAGQPDRPGVALTTSILPGIRSGYPDLLHPDRLPKDEQPLWFQEEQEKRESQRQKQRQQFLDAARKDPQLSAKIRLQAWTDVPDKERPGQQTKRASDLSAALRQVAEKSGLSVIGHYDPCWDDYYTRLETRNPDMRIKKLLRADLEEMPVWKAMEFLAEYFQVRWEKRGEVLYVRSPRVPYALMDRIDVLDPQPLPNYFQQLLKTYKPGDVIPGVVKGDPNDSVERE